MKIIECKQNTPEWYEHRLGIATASAFTKIVTPKTLKLSASFRDYIFEMLQDRIIGIPKEGVVNYTSAAMENGNKLEGEARRFYEFDNDCKVEQVGFILSDCGNFGCSPDGLINNRKGGLEVKCPMLKTHLKYLHNGTLPDEYKLQVHGSMWVTGLDYWDFLSYTDKPNIDQLQLRIERDKTTEKLGEIFSEFVEMKKEIESKIL